MSIFRTILDYGNLYFLYINIIHRFYHGYKSFAKFSEEIFVTE